MLRGTVNKHTQKKVLISNSHHQHTNNDRLHKAGLEGQRNCSFTIKNQLEISAMN